MVDGYYRTFNIESYESIKQKLLAYRLDPFIREIEAKEGKNKGLIFPFARGLRFSALLIYTIRDCLSQSDLDVNWGQIVNDNGQMCSGECDIIIHEKGFEKRWNGDKEKNIMDFLFINQKKAKLVISCKSYITKSSVEVEYCKNMLKYVDKIWLFAECCGPESADLITHESKKIGYDHFWYLYKWNRHTNEIEDNFDGWINFVEEIKNFV